ncbi:hypothetical protein LZC95_07950 [Pendulispora brunnea]|uniref:Uncharacterized protein n=1 Tax=Pendulispora brunnea TaxID=2905690 RepID=A0ABZ2KDI9_9BACT
MITIEKVGRRYYLVGDTYPIRSQISAAGGHFDRERGERGQWWVSKEDVARRFASAGVQAANGAAQAQSERPAERLNDDSKVLGRARYKGKEYLLVWEGDTKRGPAAKLAFSDGSKVFWADASAVQVTKRYQSREWRGREQPMTFGRLAQLREDYAAQRKAAADSDLRGERGEYSADYKASQRNRGPDEPIGTATWLRHGKARLAVVLVGFHPATYLRSDDAEDMGHFGLESGWYGTAYYRDATLEEYNELQRKSPRADGTCKAIPQGVSK